MLVISVNLFVVLSHTYTTTNWINVLFHIKILVADIIHSLYCTLHSFYWNIHTNFHFNKNIPARCCCSVHYACCNYMTPNNLHSLKVDCQKTTPQYFCWFYSGVSNIPDSSLSLLKEDSEEKLAPMLSVLLIHWIE